MRFSLPSARGFFFVFGIVLAQAGIGSSAYGQSENWFVAPQQPAADAPPIIHDLFEPQELPPIQVPKRNKMFDPPEDPLVRIEPTVHKVTLLELQAELRSFAASTPAMAKLPYFSDLLNSSRYTPEETPDLLKDRTVMTFDKVHGAQIEYTSADGVAYLWYPGNKIILRGQWYIRDDDVGFTNGDQRFEATAGRICYYYGPGTYNPATNRGDKPECQNAGIHEARVVDSRPGDVLGLSKASVAPFVLGGDSTTIDALLTEIKKAAKPRR